MISENVFYKLCCTLLRRLNLISTNMAVFGPNKPVTRTVRENSVSLPEASI